MHVCLYYVNHTWITDIFLLWVINFLLDAIWIEPSIWLLAISSLCVFGSQHRKKTIRKVQNKGNSIDIKKLSKKNLTALYACVWSCSKEESNCIVCPCMDLFQSKTPGNHKQIACGRSCAQLKLTLPERSSITKTTKSLGIQNKIWQRVFLDLQHAEKLTLLTEKTGGHRILSKWTQDIAAFVAEGSLK